MVRDEERRLGWRARIGVITPAVGMAVTADFHRIAPAGVALLLAQVSEPITQDTVDQLTAVAEGVEEAARRLRLPKADVVVWNTSSGSLIRGLGYDQELIRRIEAASGIPATTASTAMVQACHCLEVRRVSLATPYVEAINQLECEFLAGHGVQAVACLGLGLIDVGELIDVPPARIARLAREADHPDADAVLVCNAGWSVLEHLQALERELGKPVVSTNQASLWSAFRRAGIADPVAGHGRLLEMP